MGNFQNVHPPPPPLISHTVTNSVSTSGLDFPCPSFQFVYFDKILLTFQKPFVTEGRLNIFDVHVLVVSI